MDKKYMCPVCGWPDLDMDPAIEDYNICPCCGIEFGAYTAFWTYEHSRHGWIETGMKWWSRCQKPPDNWNPQEQLARLLATNPPKAGPNYREHAE